MMKKKILITVNSLLFILILFFVFMKNYRLDVAFDCVYGKQPGKLLAIAAENFPELGNSDLKAICVFSTLPGMDVLENVNKLCHLYSGRVSFGVIFTKKFKPEYDLGFPYKILPNYRFSCNKKDDGIDRDYFLLIQGEKIVHGTDTFDFFSLNFIIQKNIDPNLSMSTTQVSIADLKTGIVKRLTGKDLELLDLNTGIMAAFKNMTEFSKIYFFHANCSGCRLKGLIQDIKLLEILNREKTIIIFSIFANCIELKSLLDQNQIDLPVYIDTKDEFLLSGKITNEKENPIIINEGDLRRP